MFEGFRNVSATLDDVCIHAIKGGRGPALLLLHAHPQTHALCHNIGPALAEHALSALDPGPQPLLEILVLLALGDVRIAR